MIRGRVTEVDDMVFSALVTVDDEPEVVAIFPRPLWPEVQPGDIFDVEGDRIVPVTVAALTEEEWAMLRARAREKYEELRRYLD